MYNLVAYGSLINSNELAKHNISTKNIQIVKVFGYKRVFDQLPSWREVKGREKAVLNIKKDSDFWFNALVVKDLSEEFICSLDKRERGYDRITLGKSEVITYDKEYIVDAVAYIGKKGMQNNRILPNPDYLKICLDGAKEYGDQFFNDFLDTTFQNDLCGDEILINV